MADPFLHVLDVLHEGVEWQGLIFPGFLGYNRQSLRSPSEEKLEGSEACGRLGCLSDGKKHIGKEEVPVPTIFVYHPSQHLLQCLVEAFHEIIGLVVVDRCPQMFYLQQLIQINH